MGLFMLIRLDAAAGSAAGLGFSAAGAAAAAGGGAAIGCCAYTGAAVNTCCTVPCFCLMTILKPFSSTVISPILDLFIRRINSCICLKSIWLNCFQLIMGG